MRESATGEDGRDVARQIGRPPRGRWRVASRCRRGRPATIETAPVFEGGEPFPTLWWLTCPFLAEAVAGLESAGGTDEWAARLEADPVVAARMRAADEEYRVRRAAAGGGDPCEKVGVAGQRDPLKVKCLHAHVAAALAGVADPVGEAVLEELGRECGEPPRECADEG